MRHWLRAGKLISVNFVKDLNQNELKEITDTYITTDVRLDYWAHRYDPTNFVCAEINETLSEVFKEASLTFLLYQTILLTSQSASILDWQQALQAP